MKALETNLWQAGIAGLPLWIVGIVIMMVAIATIAIAVLWKRTRKPSLKEQVGAPNISKQETKA